jgi:DNA polymerase mu
MGERPQRPSLTSIAQSSTSSRLLHHHRPVHELYQLFAQMTFHVIPGKLDGELDHLYEIIRDLGGKCVRACEARFILTALQGRPRIEKAVGKDMAVSIGSAPCGDKASCSN